MEQNKLQQSPLTIVLSDDLSDDLKDALLGGGAQILVCEHIHSREYSKSMRWMATHGRDVPGTGSKIDFLVVCPPCTLTSKISFFEYHWRDGAFHFTGVGVRIDRRDV